MVFAFRSQPLKTIYIVYFGLSTLFVRLPFWIANSIIPATRQRRSWSFKHAVLVQFLRAGVGMFYATGIGGPPDAEKDAQSAAELGLVWIEPASSDLIVADVALAAKANNVHPTRTSGYWIGERDASGRHGHRARAGEKVLYTLHGGAFITGTGTPKGAWGENITKPILSLKPNAFRRAFALEYRLASAAPYTATNPFPSALLDAIAGYRYLVQDLGFDPKDILVEGDSAGGQLALNLVTYLVHSQLADLAPPGALLMLSPTADWACTHDNDPASSMTRNYYSDYIHRVLDCRYSARALRGTLSETELASNAYLSPGSLKLQNERGYFSNFPPTCIVAGEAEVMLDPMRMLRDRLVADNSAESVIYQEYANAPHAWLLVTAFEPYRSAALEGIKHWIEAVFEAGHSV
ncbi:alpha/beta-hydrolase [Exidia glandulosa HHB12029]|uniref:Alpha/beta-hydrolase n=1 Tax=Exidia glandulosa HHB12029 TaxID=1314781 RepID=A0A165FU60_EXIGL|nr:alpha/beta-hydrolase [Exidia glandulosa HHB12029]